ncbi:MAG: hypothetical protein PHO48_04855 [Candidatus Gracilibacteria bacterium]|nr:hypothetical protein [Candidatus Gracilibacteria bacterium]MDD5179381.1 hypothetical protein [Candidatus Gracilibacteria bacterium]
MPHRKQAKQPSLAVIISCTNCAKAISSKQEHCPHCTTVNELGDKYLATQKKKNSFLGLLIPSFAENRR